MRALLLSLSACLLLLVNAQAQLPVIRLNPIEKPLDSAKHYQKILIVGEGDMQAHMFLDYLSAQLIKGFNSRRIECKYEYLGDSKKVNTHAALEKAKAWPHDAILQFLPIGTESEDVRALGLSRLGPQAADNILPLRYKTKRHLQNDFDIALNENTENIWFSRLTVEMIMDKLTVFKRLRQLIIADMERQHVLPD
ncbi:hypothetical protein [Chitinophaga sp. S165]|uniref:hypothetical protein n=1 Tax=Chitinophaga sp. S165 TaxID=2135462 RepID=UPI000D8D1695|nr:hypothetical protein [Chitinophaga sp. S165]PWV53889.1 hypothetical protein C7475_102641 [Chitinophaga sp. S165]